MLNRVRAGLLADFFENRFAGVPVCAVDANLDQLVAFQSPIDLREDRGRQASAADLHYRVEAMCAGFQFAPLGG